MVNRSHATRSPTPPKGRRTRSFIAGSMSIILLAVGMGTGTGLQPSIPTGERPEETERKRIQATLEEQGREAEAQLKEARLQLRTGRTVEGLLIKREGRRVTLRIQGVDTEFDLADSIEFEELGSVVDSFMALRAATPEDDVPGRLQLVRWLRDRGAYYTALDEAIEIARDAPYSGDAQEMRRWLESQINLRMASALRAPSDDDDGDEDATRPRRKIESFPVLTPGEINLIRVYEVDFNAPPKLSIPRDTVQDFLDTYAEHELIPKDAEGRKALLRRDPLTVLDLMFRVQARPLYSEVEVLEDPRSMRLWRTQIHSRWFAGGLNSCASASCHGGQEAGRLYLNNHRTNTDATVYTNFIIADRFLLRDGTPLIDYQEPAKSPLLQMALPREKSTKPHPAVGRTDGKRGWRPYFRDESDLSFRRAVEWIRSMYAPHPDYPIGYEPPISNSAARVDPDEPQPER